MKLNCKTVYFLLPFLGFLAGATLAAADVWPQFRGPDGQGHADATGLPTTWSESENVTWKTAFPGKGWSSPVIAGTEIWMTTSLETEASEEEKEKKTAGRPDAKMLSVVGHVSLRAICVDRESGKLLHDVELFQIDDPAPIHQLNSFASPTPVIEDDKLYCHFGTYGTACLDTATQQILWQNQNLQLDHQNGPGGSPVLWGDLLIVDCDGIDVQYVAALDKRTGMLRWKTDRSGEMPERVEFRKAYCTPLLVDDGGRVQLISPAADWVYSYDPATGRELWKARYGKLGFSNVARPVVGHGMVYVCTCFMSSSMLAIRYDGSGDVTDSHNVWQFDKQMPRMPSPILVDDAIYAVSDNGIATCLDAKTGEERWHARMGGNFSASPLLVDGHLYFFNREGETIVIEPGAEYREIARNTLNAGFMASAAIADGAFFLRTETHLYRIEDQAAR